MLYTELHDTNANLMVQHHKLNVHISRYKREYIYIYISVSEIRVAYLVRRLHYKQTEKRRKVFVFNNHREIKCRKKNHRYVDHFSSKATSIYFTYRITRNMVIMLHKTHCKDSTAAWIKRLEPYRRDALIKGVGIRAYCKLIWLRLRVHYVMTTIYTFH